MTASTELRKQRPGIGTLASWLALVLCPFLLLGAVSLGMGKNAFLARPVWSDELDYWWTLSNTLRYGFSAGYNSLNEILPTVGNLGTHGPIPLLFYGLPGLLFGTPSHCIVVYNALILSLCLLAVVLCLRPRPLVAYLTAVGIVCNPYLIMYCFTSMTELLNPALLALFFTLLYKYEKTRGHAYLVFTVLQLTVCCVYRMSYIVLLLPLALVLNQGRFGWGLLKTLVPGALLCAALFFAVQAFTSPYSPGFLYKLRNTVPPSRWFLEIKHNIRVNLEDFVRTDDDPIKVYQRIGYVILMLFLLGRSFLQVAPREGRKGFSLRAKLDLPMLMAFLMMAGVLAIICVFYSISEDFRTISPVMFGAAFYMLLRKQKDVYVAYLACCLVVGLIVATSLGTLVSEKRTLFTMFEEPQRFSQGEPSPEVQTLISHTEYTVDAESPFENTLLIFSADYGFNYDYDIFVALPKGIGVSVGLSSDLPTALQSKYALGGPTRKELPGFTILAENEYGTLFIKDGYQ